MFAMSVSATGPTPEPGDITGEEPVEIITDGGMGSVRIDDAYLIDEPNAVVVGDSGLGVYPGTNIYIKPGDILHSNKNKSTFFVGHIGIVGTDGRVKHTLPVDPSTSQTVSTFLTNFDTVTLIRPNNASLSARYNAGKWATNNLYRVTSYNFNGYLSDVDDNYCSKFVWQAYKYGGGVDISDAKLAQFSTNINIGVRYWVTPSQIYKDSNNTKIKTFY